MKSSSLENESGCSFGLFEEEILTAITALVRLSGRDVAPRDNDLFSGLKFPLLILQNLSAFYVNASDSRRLIGCVRGAISCLLNCHPTGATPFVHCGLDLLTAISSSSLGYGSGLWIHACILPLLTTLLLSLKTSKLVLSSRERVIYLSKLLSALNSIMEPCPSSLLTAFSASVLDFSIADLGSSDRELTIAALMTACQIWDYQCLDQKGIQVGSPQPWESVIVEICLNSILSLPFGLHGAVDAIEFAFKAYSPSEILSRLDSNAFTSASEYQAWEYISSPCYPFRSRLAIFMILDVWTTRRDDQTPTPIPNLDESLDDMISGRILLQKALGSTLESFEFAISHWEQFGRREISLDSLFWCLCGHSECSFCPNIQNSERHLDLFGILFQWLITLQKIDSYCASAPWAHRALIGLYISKSKFFEFLMTELIGILVGIQLREFPSSKDLALIFSRFDSSTIEHQETQRILIVLFCLSRTICFLPAASRVFYLGSCSRIEGSALEKFVESYINERIVKREASIIAAAQTETLNIRCSVATGEITTTYTADEVSVDMSIKLPKLYPLRNVEVECKKRMGINEGRWRRWTLQVGSTLLSTHLSLFHPDAVQIIQLLSQHDGSVLDAILFWKRNVDKEFEGVEPCPICYSVLDPKTLALPTLQCPTCKNKFHPPCLYKWFSTSGKSKCVLCQQPFFH
jgi:hypothetical protein